MSRTRYAYNDAHIAYAGTWSTIAATGYVGTYGTGANAVGALSGNYKKTTTNGDTATMTIPSGTSTVILKGTRIQGGPAPTVKVDGVTRALAWDQTNGTTNTGAPWVVYRSCYPPIALDPATGHTIIVTAAGGGAMVDSVDLYVPEAVTAGKALIAGHSFVSGAFLSSPSTQNFAYVGCTGAGLSPVVAIAATGGTLADPDPAHSPTTPLWIAADAGTNWADQKAQVVVIMIGINELTSLYPREQATLNNSDIDQQDIVCSAALSAGTFTVTQGSNVTGSHTWNFNGGFLQNLLNTATPSAIPYTVTCWTAAGVSISTATNNVWNAAGNYMRLSSSTGPNTLMILTPSGITGGTLSIVRSNVPPQIGTAGYYKSLYQQRLLEAFWHLIANTPTVRIFMCGTTPIAAIPDETGLIPAQDYQANRPMDRLISQVCDDPTVRNNVKFVSMWDVVNGSGAIQAFRVNPVANFLVADGTHPTAELHATMGKQLERQIRASVAPMPARFR